MAASPDLQLSQDATDAAASDVDAHLHTDTDNSQQRQRTLQALASDPAALQREVMRLAAASNHQQDQLQQLATDLWRVVATHEQLEPLALALLASTDAQSRSALLSLLDALLGSDDAPPLSLLRVTTQRLRADAALEESERALLLRWGDRASEQLLAAQDAPSAAEAARLLLALHDSGGAADFKVATLVWKNLTRMSAAFGAALADGAFQADDALASVVAALEQSAQQLCSSGGGERVESTTLMTTTLKFLRLYWRAFQGQLLSYLSALTSEVEASVMALVNVAASLVDVALLRHPSASPRLQAEASRLLHMVVALAEKLGAAADTSAATREQLRVLLWHSDDDMVRAIRQRREDGESSAEPPPATATSIRTGHLLAVAAFSSSDDNVLPAKDTSEEIGGAKILAAAAMLLERYQACAWHEPIGALRVVEDLFLDALLSLLVRVDDVEELQLFLTKQLFHPDVARQAIVWEAWREFLCFGWDEDRAAAVLTMLISLAQFETEADARRCLAPGVQLEVYELIAFVYPDLPDALKRVCIDEATDVIDAIFSEGPTHAFTLKVASQVGLLEHLTAASFLKHYDRPEKEEWVAKYLGMCFECCGTVLDLLNASPAANPAQWSGMMRILDVCLLVAKAILDDSGANGTDLDELAGMLVPMSSEILTQLSKVQDRQALSSAAAAGNRSRNGSALADAKLEREASRTLSRILETSTYVLGSLGGVLKRNQNNQFVLALRDLSLISEQAPSNEASGAAVTIAWFVSRTLFDVQVAQRDLEVVWQIFSRLFQNLSSSVASGEASSGAAPHLPMVLLAFYRFLAHSNVAEHAGGSLQQMLHESVRPRFREFLALKALQTPEADRVFRAELSASHRDGVRARLGREYSRRFPGEQSSPNSPESHSQAVTKRVRDVTHDDSSSNGGCADGEGDTGSKRRKLDALASMCRRAHQMFGSPPSLSLLRAVNEQELDTATRLLEQLLASGALA